MYEDDAYLLSNTLSPDQQISLPVNRAQPYVYREYREQTINSLKHRILVFLYRRAVHLSHVDGDPFELRKFYQV